MSLELEEVLAAGRETSAPAADELTADTELSRDLTLGPAPDVDRDRGLEDELERMNLSRDRVAGEDALATTAVDAAGEDHPERTVRAFPRGEPALDPGLREPDSGAAAARTRTATQKVVPLRSNGDGVAARLDSRYVNHVLLDDPATPVKEQRGVVFYVRGTAANCPARAIGGQERYERDAILNERDSRQVVPSPSAAKNGDPSGASASRNRRAPCRATSVTPNR